MTLLQAKYSIIQTATPLLYSNLLDLVGILQTYGIFKFFTNILTTENVASYLNDLDNIFQSEPNTLLQVVDNVTHSIITLLQTEQQINAQNKFYIQTYAHLIKQSTDYRNKIESLTSILPNAKSNILQAIQNNSNISIQLFTAEYENIQSQIQFLSNQLNIIESQIPPNTPISIIQNITTPQVNSTSSVEIQLQNIAQTIQNMINSNTQPYEILLQKLTFNNIYNNSPSTQSQFIPYTI